MITHGGSELEFAPDFFQNEIRCDFEISSMMKRAWAAELEVLQVVADVCERNGLQYYADWGTLLGAVRHKGFIPWDDDIDICLKREQYAELIRIMSRELPKGFVMAGMYADSERLRRAAVCSNIRVIADEELWDFNDYMIRFHGFPYQRIGIDIFSVDYMPRDNELVDVQKDIITYGLILSQYLDEFRENGELDDRLSKMEELCGVTIPRDDSTIHYLSRLIDSVAALYGEADADEVTEYPFYVARPGYRMKKEWYQEAVKLPFENIEISVPCGYHEVLTAEYGDYMIPQKLEGGHEYPFYRNMEEELVRQIHAVGFSGTVEEFCQKVSCGEWRV